MPPPRPWQARVNRICAGFHPPALSDRYDFRSVDICLCRPSSRNAIFRFFVKCLWYHENLFTKNCSPIRHPISQTVGRGIPSRSREDQERLPTGTNDRPPSRIQYRDLHPAFIAGERSPSRFPQSDDLRDYLLGKQHFLNDRETPLVDDMALQVFHLKKNVGYIIAVKAQRIANVAVIYASSTTAALTVMPETCKRCVGLIPNRF
jgi:hypothetical protein